MNLLQMKRAMLTIVVAFAGATATTGALAAGALAIDSNQGGSYGWAVDFKSVGDAERYAVSKCGGNCQVVLRFSKGCGAYAADQTRGSTAIGWGTDSNGPAAQNRALRECQSRGGRSCIVRVWGCN
jgi:hypothetical protein